MTAFDPLRSLANWSKVIPVNHDEHPRWLPHTDAARLFVKALRPFAELGFVSGIMWLAGAPWWSYPAVAVMALPYLLLRFRAVQNEWNS